MSADKPTTDAFELLKRFQRDTVRLGEAFIEFEMTEAVSPDGAPEIEEARTNLTNVVLALQYHSSQIDAVIAARTQ